MSDTLTPSMDSGGSALAEPRSRFASQLAAAVVRRIEVPSFVSASGRASSIRVGEVSLGEVSIDHVDVADVETRFSTGNISLTNARAIDDTRLPSDGFGITGLDFGALEIESFSAPAADSRQLTIGRFQPDAPLQLPDVEVGGIALPEVEIPDAGSAGAVSLMDVQPEEFEAPVFKIGNLFKATFIATPVLHLQIGALVLSDLSASASIGAVQIRGVSTPVTVRGVRLGELTLDQLSVDQISI